MATKKSRRPRGWSKREKRVLRKVYPYGNRENIERSLWLVRPPWRHKRLKWDAIRKMAQRLGVHMKM